MSFERERIRLELAAVMLAEGRVSQHNSLGRQHPESRQPTMAGSATAEIVRGVLRNRVLSHGERLRIAEEIVRLEKYGPPDRHEETAEQFAYRVVTQYVGVSSVEVGRREMKDPRAVRAIRKAAGQDSKGHPLKS